MLVPRLTESPWYKLDELDEPQAPAELDELEVPAELDKLEASVPTLEVP